jgi:hypothetical protein
VTSLRRPLAAAVAALTAAGCTFPALVSPTPTPSPVPTASPTLTPTATPSRPPSASPTPDFADVPSFGGGEIVATATDGLRVRQRPGTKGVVVAGLLPLGTELEVRLGPIPVDGLGWYLVADVPDGEPEFDEGWIAAGFEPEPFLRSTGRTADDSPVVAAYALTGDAEYGPRGSPLPFRSCAGARRLSAGSRHPRHDRRYGRPGRPAAIVLRRAGESARPGLRHRYQRLRLGDIGRPRTAGREPVADGRRLKDALARYRACGANARTNASCAGVSTAVG